MRSNGNIVDQIVTSSDNVVFPFDSGNIEFIRVVTKYDSHMVSFRDEFGRLLKILLPNNGVKFLGSIPLVYAVQGNSCSKF